MFAEDINIKSVTVSCIDGGDWDRGAPTCQGKGSYILHIYSYIFISVEVEGGRGVIRRLSISR